MKKFGFTLSEVLITMGIIGVIAALTTPALVKSTGNAQAGPTLAKVVSTIENAHQKIMMDRAITDLDRIGGDIVDYLESLSEYVTGCSFDENVFSFNRFRPTPEFYNGNNFVDQLGDFYDFTFSNNITILIGDLGYARNYNRRGSYIGRFADMLVDINGIRTAPNVVGKDIFAFEMDRNGKLTPYGSGTFGWLHPRSPNEFQMQGDTGTYTSMVGNYACNEDVVTTGLGCSGSIFDNDLKVIY